MFPYGECLTSYSFNCFKLFHYFYGINCILYIYLNATLIFRKEQGTYLKMNPLLHTYSN